VDRPEDGLGIRRPTAYGIGEPGGNEGAAGEEEGGRAPQPAGSPGLKQRGGDAAES
jgi:hypothetical protein